MKAQEINKTVGIILEHLDSIAGLDGHAKIVALRTAANTLENILNQESLQALLAANMATLFPRK